MHAVFKFDGENEKIRKIYQDDIIGRQTIVKRDARSLGIEGNALYLLFEGSEEAIERARELIGDYEMRGEEAKKIYDRIKEAEDAASAGMGAIFG